MNDNQEEKKLLPSDLLEEVNKGYEDKLPSFSDENNKIFDEPSSNEEALSIKNLETNLKNINFDLSHNFHPMPRRIDSCCNLQCYNLEPHQDMKGKNESQIAFKPMNYCFSTNNNINNSTQQAKNIDLNIIPNNNLQIVNNQINNFNNFNINFPNNSFHSGNNNLNMSYNYQQNYKHYINDSFEDILNISKKREDSWNSCPGFIGNHLSFNTTTSTNKNKPNNMNFNIPKTNFTNFNPNRINDVQNQNIISMQNLFLNLNPYTASLMRNNTYNNNFNIMNNNSNINQSNLIISNNNNNNFYSHYNNFHPLPSYNNNRNNSNHKKSHSIKSTPYPNTGDNYNFSSNNYINNINIINSLDGNSLNDNLSYSSIGSNNKGQNKKKRTSLFQNWSNKEKDYRDFKRFCDGLKTPIDEYICTQIGSRIMQKYLKKFPSYIRTLLINKISPHFEKLICDTYGNYFCQKLYVASDLNQRVIILNSLKYSFMKISKNNCGAHVIQFIIKSFQSVDEKNIILQYIKNYELELAYDQEGAHILQKIISCYKEEERENLTQIICDKKNLFNLCCNQKSVGIIKKMILHTKNDEIKLKIIDGIIHNCVDIGQNPFGNYVIQNIFEEWDSNIVYILIDKCLDNSITFSKQIYSYNIISKIFKLFINNKEINQKIKNLFFAEKNFLELYSNQFGKILIVELSKLLKSEEKIEILKKIKDNNDEKIKNEVIEILNILF